MQEADVKTITLNRGANGLGFNIRGGKDQPHVPQDTGIFVTKIRETGAAAQDGTLQEGDKILELNGQSMEDINHNEAVHLFLNAGDEVTLKLWSGAEDKLLAKDRQETLEEASKLDYTKISLAVGAVVGLSIIVFYFRKDIGEGVKNFSSKLGLKKF